ncbi:TPA: hypothetical protein DEA21_05610 [Candidatus Uhrbacteria bacterium]|nr:hypothetical protein [Candidatus Uhrbacteria bacterium]
MKESRKMQKSAEWWSRTAGMASLAMIVVAAVYYVFHFVVEKDGSFFEAVAFSAIAGLVVFVFEATHRLDCLDEDLKRALETIEVRNAALERVQRRLDVVAEQVNRATDDGAIVHGDDETVPNKVESIVNRSFELIGLEISAERLTKDLAEIRSAATSLVATVAALVIMPVWQTRGRAFELAPTLARDTRRQISTAIFRVLTLLPEINLKDTTGLFGDDPGLLEDALRHATISGVVHPLSELYEKLAVQIQDLRLKAQPATTPPSGPVYKI